MMSFVKVAHVFLTLCIFHILPLQLCLQPPRESKEQPTYIIKKIGDTVYHVKLSFSTISAAMMEKNQTTTTGAVAAAEAEAEKTLVDFSMNKTMNVASIAAPLARRNIVLMLMLNLPLFIR